MAIIGASRPYFAKYRNAGSSVIYEDGGVMGALVKFNIAAEASNNNNNDFYADNRVKETQKNKFSSGTLTVQTDDLRQEVSKVILGVKEETLPTIPGITDNDVKELIYDDDTSTPYLSIGMIQKKQVDSIDYWRAVILTKVMFEVPADAATTEGETIEWQTPELTASFMRDDSTKHRWKREATFSTEEQADTYLRYMLNIPASDNALLAQLRIGTLTLTPEFDPDVTTYTLTTANDTNIVAASAEDAAASVAIEVNGEAHENGAPATWESGSNTVTVTVTAANGETTKTYSITVTKS